MQKQKQTTKHKKIVKIFAGLGQHKNIERWELEAVNKILEDFYTTLC